MPIDAFSCVVRFDPVNGYGDVGCGRVVSVDHQHVPGPFDIDVCVNRVFVGELLSVVEFPEPLLSNNIDFELRCRCLGLATPLCLRRVPSW